MGGDIGLTYFIQELYKSFQTGPMEALNVRPQVLVVEEYIKEPSVLFVGGLELLELLLGIRNRVYHAVVTDYIGSQGVFDREDVL